NNNDDLPDSTDFVCGTLDEDRPLEQAYINRKKVIEAAKHKPRPQDIDPSFPTSDPEMDEEDDEDLDDPEEEHDEDEMVHGEMDSEGGKHAKAQILTSSSSQEHSLPATSSTISFAASHQASDEAPLTATSDEATG
ncbi:hypothetical protein KC331_g14772, partial [Hortaea werneckii]